jgi:hypothetical protein
MGRELISFRSGTGFQPVDFGLTAQEQTKACTHSETSRSEAKGVSRGRT